MADGAGRMVPVCKGISDRTPALPQAGDDGIRPVWGSSSNGGKAWRSYYHGRGFRASAAYDASCLWLLCKGFDGKRQARN